ncbi:hypothetical protein NEUTE1DRAFT_101533 [Neurospora tetrasperma FGSC 2508]|uniref:Uncharacterized protein n=1 Tax=Neurospora tetrasperma (strain FGSC 2508 / ATCC MYA-4615 / P0657) TaxID=510951 RepID=F8MP40_NEUT8|nr:uncharacterized protein NEUTE1DRAFT_101533 [Neurospora tetrasperma FGSC 2508]EGO56259.1 hypothetical protein NEUTE1DRAFT_101533 [Neurospora tetrasperma FGSC 2508]
MAATSQDWPSACPYPIRCPTQMSVLRASFSILFGRGSILPPQGHSFLFQPEPKQMLLERD